MSLKAQLRPVVRDAVINRFIAGSWYPRRFRNRLLRLVGHDLHPSALVSPGVFLGAWTGLTVGEDSFINYGCFFDLGAPTVIGKNCALGYQVIVLTVSHRIGPRFRRAGAIQTSSVRIGDGVWIGARAVIQPGVTIGDGCVIAAGSVVTADCKPDGLYAGTPATRRRDLNEQEQDPVAPE